MGRTRPPGPRQGPTGGGKIGRVTTTTDQETPTGVRSLADRYVRRLADLDTRVATSLGTHPGDDRVPDLSPEGERAIDDLANTVLTELPTAAVAGEDDRRCARLLPERL